MTSRKIAAHDYDDACVPWAKNRMVACLTCKLILPQDQFIKEKCCPNCLNRISDYE